MDAEQTHVALAGDKVAQGIAVTHHQHVVAHAGGQLRVGGTRSKPAVIDEGFRRLYFDGMTKFAFDVMLKRLDATGPHLSVGAARFSTQGQGQHGLQLGMIFNVNTFIRTTVDEAVIGCDQQQGVMCASDI